jgi:tetratricopeptide (TPR) repeat protein
MYRKGFFPFLLLLLLAACGESHEQMLRQLTELERMNRADSVMHNDTLAEHLVRYFDRHGDANERMRAHYILGRTYADMGEAPAALNAYLDAADCADTTAIDCDYHTLSRVYGQMADVFYWQNLMDDYLNACDKSADYAWRDCDTMQALNEEAHKPSAYNRLKLYDKVIADFDVLFNQFCKFYGLATAAKYCILPVNALLEKGEYEKAGEYLSIVEQKSGYFDSLGNIEKGREGFYYYKGRYFMAIGQPDSAEYYFRKELSNGTDAMNQNMGALGLSRLFMKVHRPDSAAKYALYSYEMMDSVYSQMATAEVERTAAMYNYSRHQQHALEMEQMTNKERVRGIIIACLLLFLILLLLFYRWRSVLKMREYKVKMMAYRQMLQKNEADSQGQGKKKHEISQTLYNSSIRKRLLDKISQDELATEEDWQEVSSIILQTCPGFNEALQGFLPSINSTYYRICLGVKLQLSPAQIATLVSRSRQAVASARSRMYKDVFAKNGKPSDFDDFILSLN